MKRIKRNETWRKYHIPGCSNIHRIKQNVIFISTANSLAHEKKKLELCYILKKSKHNFITESARNSDNRRIDVVDLNTGEEYEIVHKNLDKKLLERYKREKINIIYT